MSESRATDKDSLAVEPSGKAGQLVEALRKIAAIPYQYCRACRARSHNHMEHYTFNKIIAAHPEVCSCKSCNEECEHDCPRGIAREALRT